MKDEYPQRDECGFTDADEVQQREDEQQCDGEPEDEVMPEARWYSKKNLEQ